MRSISPCSVATDFRICARSASVLARLLLEPPLEQLDVDGHRVERVANLVRHRRCQVLELSIVHAAPPALLASMPYSASLL